MARDADELDRIATDVVTRLAAEPRPTDVAVLAVAYDAALMGAAAAACPPIPEPRSTT